MPVAAEDSDSNNNPSTFTEIAAVHGQAGPAVMNVERKVSAERKLSAASLRKKSLDNNNNKSRSRKTSLNLTNSDSSASYPSCTTLNNEWLTEAETEVNESATKRKTGLKELRAWLKTPNIRHRLRGVRSDANFLLRFLRFQKFVVDDAKSVLEKYVAMRTVYPEWFANLDPKEPRVRALLDAGYLIALPQRDTQGRKVIFTRASAIDTSTTTALDIMRAHIITYEALAMDEENQVKGITYVLDESGVGWNHIAIWSPAEITKAIACCERCLPMRHQEINLIHLPWIMQVIYQFAKSLLSQKLKDRINLHSNYEKFRKDNEEVAVMLPEAYGGDGDYDSLLRNWLDELDSKRTGLLELDKMSHHPTTASPSQDEEPAS